jgi:Rps23 Pro-64 3,4-dihydroxylase Tpa1-like proline 4-hydroxylase
MLLLNPLVCCGAVISTPPATLSAGAIHAIERGGIHVEQQWLPPKLISALRADAEALFAQGLFAPDGLTNTAVERSRQGFSKRDRQTFRGDGWMSDAGNRAARLEFSDRMYDLRKQLASGLGRPSLAVEGDRKHETTYNWYEIGAKLGRHLDEHHEETKGTKGWLRPTRRSVTWLVYLNDEWKENEGGALRTFPRAELSAEPVGADKGNLQVGWLDGTRPVFLEYFDSGRELGLSRLYCRAVKGSGGGGGGGGGVLGRGVLGSGVLGSGLLGGGGLLGSGLLGDGRRETLSTADFEVPRQPVDFSRFLRPEYAAGFEQISTTRLDPRFATGAPAGFAEFPELHHVDVVPAAGTLVLFDSVSLPHLVREVTGARPRVAATGWFHEDSVFSFS